MKLGGPLFHPHHDPDSWVAACRAHGYAAASCPVTHEASDEEINSYRMAAEVAGITIAEVGAWSNPLCRDPATRKAALDLCKNQLALADRIGARCCVNIAGSLGEKWDGPHPDDLTLDAYDLIVETVREIIDAVKPSRTYYTLETMPWMYPNSVEIYGQLLLDIDRPGFAVHFDPVNLINSPERYFRNADLIEEAFRQLGPHIRSCHAKDIRLGSHLTVHLDEVAPGDGGLDYRTFLRELSKLPPETPLILEHLASQEEYARAADHIRGIAVEE